MVFELIGCWDLDLDAIGQVFLLILKFLNQIFCSLIFDLCSNE